MKMTAWLCTILWISLKIHFVLGTDIECIPISKCPLANKRHSPAAFKFFHDISCGYDGEPLIWCPILSYCTTPDGRNGTCTPLSNCSYIQSLNRNKIRSYRCKDYTDDYYVCCPKQEKLLPDPKKLECGTESDEEDRIYGGTITSLKQFPWTALLVYNRKGRKINGCGGSLINSRYILTAAHCIDQRFLEPRKLKLIQVVLGEHDLRNSTDCEFNFCAPPPLIIKPNRLIIHQNFQPKSVRNDIGLIELSQEVQYSDYVRPICLIDRKIKLKPNETFTVTGWGQTLSGTSSPVKLQAKIKFGNLEECQKLKQNEIVDDKQICIGTNNTAGTCYGDSGGPLMITRFESSSTVRYLAGLTSFGTKVCGPTTSSVYTGIYPYLDWIKTTIK